MIIHDKWRREALEDTPTSQIEQDLKQAKLEKANIDWDGELDGESLDYYEDVIERLESELFEREIIAKIPESLVVAGTDRGSLIVREVEWDRTKVLTIYGWTDYKWLRICKSIKEAQAVVGV